MSHDQTQLRSIRLRIWLPLIVMCSGLAGFLVLVGIEHLNYQRDLQMYSSQVIHSSVLSIKRDVETALRRQYGAGVNESISSLGLEPSIRYAALMDESGVVMAATRFAWRGQIAAQAIPDYPGAIVEKAIQTRSVAMQTLGNQYEIVAVTPVVLGLQPGEVRTHRQGSLLVVFDIKPLAAQASTHVVQQSILLACMVSTLGFLLLYLSRRYILQPINLLRQSLAQIGEGLFDHLPVPLGQGEFREVGEALVHMAHDLQGREQALGKSEARFRQLAEATSEAVILHENGIVLDANAAAERLLRIPSGTLIGQSLFNLVAEHCLPMVRQRAMLGLEGTWEVDILDSSGEVIPAEYSVREQREDGLSIRIVALRDFRERLQAQAEIQKLAHFDALTGLPNRRQLLERIAGVVESVGKSGHRAALAVLNIDAFKSINDSLGMVVGDEVLCTIAQRLSARLGKGQTLARVEGDTFAILISGLMGSLEEASAESARAVDLLLESLSAPIEVQAHTLHLNAVVGIVMMPNDSQNPPELLREAETAMHQAKQGGGRIQFFAHELQEAASLRLALRNDLLRTLKANDGQLLLYYQPQIAASGRLIGLEALVRWQHPDRGLIAPDAFIAEAEASGLIVPLGEFVLREALTALQRWRAQFDHASWVDSLTVAVNVSPRQFREPKFAASVERALQDSGMDALSLELELTESVVADDLEDTLKKMKQLRCHGVRFALDDFGTGYSSLAYLKRLPIDTLKIDRSFVMDIDAPLQMEDGKRPAVLIEAIVAMAHQLDLFVMAEGIETPAQLKRLQRAGCDGFQGYYFSRPLPEAALLNWISAYQEERR